jgi:hypothetical protein
MQPDVPLYAEGNTVYHLTEDTPGVVTGILYSNGGIRYQVTWQGRNFDFHYGYELTKERPFFTKRSDDSESL